MLPCLQSIRSVVGGLGNLGMAGMDDERRVNFTKKNPRFLTLGKYLHHSQKLLTSLMPVLALLPSSFSQFAFVGVTNSSTGPMQVLRGPASSATPQPHWTGHGRDTYYSGNSTCCRDGLSGDPRINRQP